ncbi:MAG: MGH1-like glycoside hydrolase domain-containing protein, partial [Rubrobacter sp.]
FSAILVAANETLMEICEEIEAPEADRATISAWISRGRLGLKQCWDPALGLCLDHDVLSGAPVRARTVAGFAPLVAGNPDPKQLETLLQTLDSSQLAGNEELRWPSLPPSTSPEDPGFHPRSYWRGPSWPVADWLLWWSLTRAGESERAEEIRQTSLKRLACSGFAEYFEPFTGEPLGSADQSWTAAVALDWLSEDNGESRE